MNGVHETTNTVGTGTITTAAVVGRPRFSEACKLSEVHPCAVNDGNNWEWGYYTIGAGNTLIRSIIKATYVNGVYNDVNPTPISLSGNAAKIWLSNIASSMAPSLPIISSVYGRKGYYSAHWCGIPTGSLAVTANRLYVIPFRVDSEIVINGFYFDMNTSGAASTIARICMYNMQADGQPGGIICETADIDTSVASGILAPAITATLLKPGWYYIGMLCSGTPTLAAYPSTTAGINPMGISPSASECLPLQFLYKAISAGWTSMPAAPTGLSYITVNIGSFPAIALKVA